MGTFSVLGRLAGGFAEAAERAHKEQFAQSLSERKDQIASIEHLMSRPDLAPEQRAFLGQKWLEGTQTPLNKKWKFDLSDIPAVKGVGTPQQSMQSNIGQVQMPSQPVPLSVPLPGGQQGPTQPVIAQGAPLNLPGQEIKVQTPEQLQFSSPSGQLHFMGDEEQMARQEQAISSRVDELKKKYPNASDEDLRYMAVKGTFRPPQPGENKLTVTKPGEQVINNEGRKVFENSNQPPEKAGDDFNQFYKRYLKEHGVEDNATNEDKAHEIWTKNQERINISAGNQQDNREFNMYKFASGEISKLAKPVNDALGRMDRINTSLAQNTPTADALIAPELLTVMAGGQGSGLRMNEAEISRIVGGRSKWESLKAAANQWSLDPSKANSITAEQRTEIRALVNAANKRLRANKAILDKADDDISNSEDIKEQKQILSKARRSVFGENGGTARNYEETRIGPNDHQIGRIGTDWYDVKTGQKLKVKGQ